MADTENAKEAIFHFRPSFIIWTLAITFWLLVIAFGVLWWMLPTWSPTVVVLKSPWIGPAFRAAIIGKMSDEFIARRGDWEQSFVPYMCDQLQSVNVEYKKMSLRCLQKCKNDPITIPYLITILKDTDQELAHTAAVILIKHKDPIIYQPLVDFLPTITNEYSQFNFASLLGTHSNPKLLPIIQTSLLGSSDAKARALGCITIKSQHIPDRLSLYSKHIGVLHAGDIDAIEYSLGINSSTDDKRIIQQFLESNDIKLQLTGIYAATLSKDKQFAPFILKFMDSPEDSVRLRAIKTAGRFEYQPIREKLKIIATLELNDDIAVLAIKSYASMPTWSDDLLLFMKLPQPKRRAAALYAIDYDSKFTDEQLKQIALLENDPDENVVEVYEKINRSRIEYIKEKNKRKNK